MNHKSILRKLILDCRRLLSDEEFEKRNADICSQVLNLIQRRDFKSIHLFLPITRNREVDLTLLFPTLWQEGRRIMISKTDFQSKQMAHFWLEESTELELNNFDIPEPKNAKSAELQVADLMIVPLLTADHEGNRLGYGGGYYDRLLANFKGHTIGVSLGTLLDHLGTDEWDIPVKQVLFFKPN